MCRELKLLASWSTVEPVLRDHCYERTLFSKTSHSQQKVLHVSGSEPVGKDHVLWGHIFIAKGTRSYYIIICFKTTSTAFFLLNKDTFSFSHCTDMVITDN